MGTMRQSSQSWNRLASFVVSSPTSFENVMKIRSPISVMLLANTDPENRKITHVPKGLKAASSKCSLPYVQNIPKISWKSIQHFFSNDVHSHGLPPQHHHQKKKKRSWVQGVISNTPKNIPGCSLYRVPHIIKIIWNPFTRNVNNAWRHVLVFPPYRNNASARKHVLMFASNKICQCTETCSHVFSIQIYLYASARLNNPEEYCPCSESARFCARCVIPYG